MDLSRLEVFRDVARLGSLAAAARAWRLDASAVSRLVAALEAELGVRLFQRTTRSLTLTEAGQTYLDRIEPLIEELAAAREAAAGLVEQPRGLLRVTASSAYGQAVLGPLLASFHQAHPLVDLELVLTDDNVDLVAERIDVALRLGPRPTGDLIASLLQMTEKRLVASPAYLEAHPPILAPAQVADHPCLVFALEGYREAWLFRDALGQVTSVPVTARIATTNAILLRDCAIAGLGLALLSDWLADAEIAAGRLQPVLPAWTAAAGQFEMAIWILYPSKRFLPLKARVFIDHVRANVLAARASAAAARRLETASDSSTAALASAAI